VLALGCLRQESNLVELGGGLFSFSVGNAAAFAHPT
jgi:hypothetical protein